MFEFGPQQSAGFDGRYASRVDYCRIFQEDMHSLYLLSFLLTANHAKAEQCYLDSLESAVKGKPVFKQWAQSWCKRSVIQTAIRLVFSDCAECDVRDHWPESSVGSAIDNVTRLAQLERVVFVMSVLARYSDRECSILLNCTVQDIVDARLLALRTIGSMPVRGKISGSRAHEDVLKPQRSREARITPVRHGAEDRSKNWL
jgi:hypothetical protein